MKSLKKWGVPKTFGIWDSNIKQARVIIQESKPSQHFQNPFLLSDLSEKKNNKKLDTL